MSRKHYEAMLSAENRANQVESAILTLQFADNLFREREKTESKSVRKAYGKNHRTIAETFGMTLWRCFVGNPVRIEVSYLTGACAWRPLHPT